MLVYLYKGSLVRAEEDSFRQNVSMDSDLGLKEEANGDEVEKFLEGSLIGIESIFDTESILTYTSEYVMASDGVILFTT